MEKSIIGLLTDNAIASTYISDARKIVIESTVCCYCCSTQKTLDYTDNLYFYTRFRSMVMIEKSQKLQKKLEKM